MKWNENQRQRKWDKKPEKIINKYEIPLNDKRHKHTQQNSIRMNVALNVECFLLPFTTKRKERKRRNIAWNIEESHA